MLGCMRKCYGCGGSQGEAAKDQGNTPSLLPPGLNPYANIDSTLRGLAGAAVGFGSASIGGLEGNVYHVTTLDEDGPGSLRDACKKQEPLWIVFDLSGIILLTSGLRVTSYKTIDGRGQRVKIMGKGLQLREAQHVIICNLEFEAGRGSDVDAIQMKPNTKHVWIDRCSLSDYDDGLIDITRQSTNVTVSRCHFFNHDKTMLLGASPRHIEDRILKITIHHCFFDGTRQRHPRLRFGKVHLFNNYTRNWGIYAVCSGVEGQILSQCNIYEAGTKKKTFEYYAEKAADTDDIVAGSIRSEGDIFLNGAQYEVRNPTDVFKAEDYYLSDWTMALPGNELMLQLQQITGWQDIPLPVT